MWSLLSTADHDHPAVPFPEEPTLLGMLRGPNFLVLVSLGKRLKLSQVFFSSLCLHWRDLLSLPVWSLKQEMRENITRQQLKLKGALTLVFGVGRMRSLDGIAGRSLGQGHLTNHTVLQVRFKDQRWEGWLINWTRFPASSSAGTTDVRS